MNEMRYWERIRFEIPHYAVDIYRSNENLRVLRESVMLIVRDYNRIIVSLQPRERALFKDQIMALDKNVHPGMVKLTWVSDGIVEYVRECRMSAQKVRQLIEYYKNSTRLIGSQCSQMSHTLMVRLDGKKVYEEDAFEVEQRRHREQAQKKLLKMHAGIVNTLRSLEGVGHLSHTQHIQYLEIHSPLINIAYDQPTLAQTTLVCQL